MSDHYCGVAGQLDAPPSLRSSLLCSMAGSPTLIHRRATVCPQHDAVRAVVYLCDVPTAGPVNVVTNHCQQIEFAAALAAALWRPCLAPVPAFALRLLLGHDMAQSLLLASHRVAPKVLAGSGFRSRDVGIRDTLASLYR